MIRKLSTQLREKNAQNHNTQEAYQDRDSGHPNTAKPDTQIIKIQPEPSKIQDPQYTKRATATTPKNRSEIPSRPEPKSAIQEQSTKSIQMQRAGRHQAQIKEVLF